MERYEAPEVLATFSADELAEEAAVCNTYEVPTITTVSDRGLKEEIAEIESPVERLVATLGQRKSG